MTYGGVYGMARLISHSLAAKREKERVQEREEIGVTL
jgi:hypothetical protein